MEMNRRRFIKKSIALSALTIGGGSILSSCGGVGRADLPVAGQKPETIRGLDQTGFTILQYAAMAPSGHNSQPWLVKVLDQRQWIVGADPVRQLPMVDPDNREVMLSIGAFMENLAVAASAFGLKTEMEVIAKDAFDQDVLKVTLNASAKKEYPLKRLSQRRTVKNGFLSDEIKSQDVSALSAHLKGHLHYFPRGGQHAKCIEEGVVENFRKQTQRDEAQKELIKWLRLSNADARKFRDGLTTEGMEITGLKGWFVRSFFAPDDFLKPDFRQQGIDLCTKMAVQGGGWMIITSDGREVADLIDTGRRFQKMALLAKERMIALHPMTQTLEEKSGQKEIAQNHGSGIIPQFILRVGYLSSYPDPVSLRRPVQWFVRS